MTGRMGINFSRAEDLSASLGAASERIGATLEELDRQLGILSQEWSGGASESYAQAMAQTSAALAAMNHILAQVERVSRDVADRHREAETEVAQLWA